MQIAKIEPLTVTRAVRGPFDYRLPTSMAQAEVGSVCVVPFGRRRATGVVVGRAEDSSICDQRLLEPYELLDDSMPGEVVSLCEWVAAEYCSTPARALALACAPGTTANGTRRMRPRARWIVAATAAAAETAQHPGRLGASQRAAIEFLLQNGPTDRAELRSRLGCSGETLRRLEARGLIELERCDGAAGGQSLRLSKPAPALTAAQRRACEAIAAAIDDQPAGGRSFLLHGVTASGKTEVYLRAAERALERGRGVIMLVPEIGLTGQTVARFRERFGEVVSVVHSRMSERERYEQWRRVRTAAARICVGPRSAVFAPVVDLGCVIVDEEHDPSYKQQQDPRYDAREVAERRIAGKDGVLVLGSATPRPESFERHTRLILSQRVDRRPLPQVELVSMAGATACLHPRTREALEHVRRRGEKAIVCVNRRGWSNFLSCRSCGRVWKCPNCDVSLVLHRHERLVRCHHCGHTENAVTSCPDCASVSVARHGLGTERLEVELSELVAPLAVTRLDSDAISATEPATEMLERFGHQKGGVLVGTQMVAKGHDFPEVTLAVVIDADATLRFPDFRSEERAFSLVCQLAGRSGRGPAGGRVVCQALDSAARPLRFAASHDSEGFLISELERRRALCYPPFSHLIRVVASCADSGPELEAAEALRAHIETMLGASAVGEATSVLGPACLFRLRGRYRAAVCVKACDRAAAVTCVRRALERTVRAQKLAGVAFSVDVDPQ